LPLSTTFLPGVPHSREDSSNPCRTVSEFRSVFLARNFCLPNGGAQALTLANILKLFYNFVVWIPIL
jgi:hypothetical protein